MKPYRQNGFEARNEPGSDKQQVRIFTPIFSTFETHAHQNIFMIVTSVAKVEIAVSVCETVHGYHSHFAEVLLSKEFATLEVYTCDLL